MQRHSRLQGWTLTDFLLADLFAVLVGKAHPSRPKPAPDSTRHATLARRLQEQQARLKANPPEGV